MSKESINPFGNVLPRHIDVLAARAVAEIMYVDTQPEGLPDVAKFPPQNAVQAEAYAVA